jgi:hypothetical protein
MTALMESHSPHTKNPWHQMYISITSNIMPRTTLDLDASVLSELRRRGRREGKSMGQVASELLAVGMAEVADRPAPALEWRTDNLGEPLVDLEDKEAVRKVLDEAG